MKLRKFLAVLALGALTVTGLTSCNRSGNASGTKPLKVGAAVYGMRGEFMRVWAEWLQQHPAVKSGEVEITVFDGSTEVIVPSLVALPASGALTARVSGIGATLDVTDFSLDEDRDQLFGIAAEPAQIP